MGVENSAKIHNDLTAWSQTHSANNRLLRKYGDEYAEDWKKNRELIGYQFDFMEGKDSNNNEEYMTQIEKLAQGDMSSFDKNHDGKVEFDKEFDSKCIFGAVNSRLVPDSYDKDSKIKSDTTRYLLFKAIDEKMENSDHDGTLSEKELESFFINLDRFNGTELTKEDGVFDIDGVDNFVNWFIENNFTEDERNEAKEKMEEKNIYYEGY